MEKSEANKLGLRSYKDQENFKSEKFIKIYANNVGLSVSNWDISLIFGEIVELNSNGAPVVEQKVKVNMTREFAKALSNLLITNLNLYEEHFGEIKIVDPTGVLAGLRIDDQSQQKSIAPKKKKD